MAKNVYIVMFKTDPGDRTDFYKPEAVFTNRSEAEAYIGRENKDKERDLAGYELYIQKRPLHLRNRKLDALKKKAREWVKDYDNHKEHDLHLAITLKDDAYTLLRELVRL